MQLGCRLVPSRTTKRYCEELVDRPAAESPSLLLTAQVSPSTRVCRYTVGKERGTDTLKFDGHMELMYTRSGYLPVPLADGCL